MNKFKKILKAYRKTALLILGILIVVVPIIFFLRRNNTSEAAWFDETWQYRKKITVTVVSSASDISNLETLLTIDTTGITAKLQTNCEDLRFTNATGKTLPYFIDSCNDNSATNKVWVMIDLVPKNTTTYVLYMYYGNPTAITASDTSTFYDVNGLEGYWPMNESSWTNNCSTLTIKDYSVNNLDAKSCPNSTGPTGNVTGQYGKAGSFDGSDDYATIADNALLKPSVFSVALWVKKNAEPPDFARVVEKYKNTVTRQGWTVLFGNVGPTRKVYFDLVNSAGGEFSNYGTGSDLPISTWRHYVWTFDGSSIKTYENGVYVGTSPFTGTFQPSTNPLEFGRDTEAGGGSYGNVTIDDTRFYSRVLTDAEAYTLYSRPNSITATTITTAQPSTSFAAEEKSQGPVSYWKFEEGTGTAINDAMATNNDGTLTSGPTWATEDMCVSGKCIKFDGTDDHVLVSNSTTLQSQNLTVSAWVKNQATSGDRAIIGKQVGTSTSRSYLLYLDNNDSLEFQVNDSGGTAVIADDPESFSLNQNEWTYVVGVWDGSRAYIYKNGRLMDSIAGSKTIGYDSNPIHIGATSFDADTTPDGGYWQGFIDEVKFYNYARTGAQILNDYNSGKNGDSTNQGISASLGVNKNQNNQWLSDKLVGYWKMDEAAAGARADSSGNGYTLTQTSGDTIAVGTGKFGNAADVESGDVEGLYIADNENLSITGDYTISAWFNKESTAAGDNAIVAKADTGANKTEFYLVQTASTSIVMHLDYTGTGTGVTVSTAYPNVAGVWNFVVAWYDSKAQTVNIQLNGGPVASAAVTSTPLNSTSEFMIGADRSSSIPQDVFDGLIDEVRIYKKVLTESERSRLYDWGPGPLFYWNLDQNSGTPVVDNSGNGNTCTIGGSVPYAPGKYGAALDFPNSGQCASASPITTITTNITMEAWIYWQSTSETGVVFYNGNSGANGYGMYISDGTLANGNKITLLLGGLNANATTSNITITPRVWTHLALTRDSTTWRLYKNGILDSTGTANPNTPGTNTNIGNGFTGIIDDVKFYTYPRSQKQIVEDMNAGHPIGGSPVSSMVGYWNFDEQQGSTANNKGYGGSSANGTVGGAAWKIAGSSTCKVNGCLSFDATDDYIDAGSAAAVDDVVPLTYSAWIKPASVGEGSNGRIFEKGATRWYVNDSRILSFEQNYDSFTHSLRCSTSINAITFNQWQHIAVTWDGANSCNNIFFYINGNKVTTFNQNNNGTTRDSNASSTLYIGNNGAAGSRTFDGYIDELKIYSAVLTPEEIKIDYNAGSAIALGGLLGIQDNEGFGGNPPLVWWKFDENTGTPAPVDSSGNENTGTQSGSVTSSNWTNGKYGSGLSFDGSDDVIADTSLSTSLSGDFTLSAWFKGGVQSSQNRFVAVLETLGCGATISLDSSGNVVVDGSGGPTSNISTTGTDYDNNTWHHASVIRSSTTYSLYVDGMLIGTSGGTAPTYTRLKAGGIAASDCGSNRYFSGNVDQVVVYNYARTQAQVTYDYNRGAPFAWYKFDECQGTTAYNAAPTGSGLAAGTNGTLLPGANDNTTVGTCGSGTTTEMWNDGTTGKASSALGLDGNDDLAVLGDSFDNIIAGADKQFSFTTWVKPSTLGLNNVLIAKYADSNCSENQRSWFARIASNNTVAFSWSTANAASSRGVTTNTRITDADRWYHIAITYDGSIDSADGLDRVKIYVNGNQESTVLASTFGSLFDIVDTTAHIGIGRGASSSGISCVAGGANSGFKGLIDDVRLYNYVLAPDQIKQIMNNGAVYFGPTEGTP